MGVRWDAVVQDREFWSEAAPPSIRAQAACVKSSVQVWLFGSLANGAERPVNLEFRGPFCVADVVAKLGNLYGTAFLDRVTDSAGAIIRNCRVFVNGQAVDDATTPIQIDAPHADIELILLTAAEGG
ncbi:MAG: hypothetical protein A3G25_03955 [Betaproteobacteria bacterium RIFCSPLOWO2_12_FULL_63_13]|nr:MAG: hypothetical protein A3H32_01605 [Betaproteobacteria bacterium RIFCSPLOWO2_02_FULL_63_19]OGA45685.1 MAG: hypothetical protein A3G25_03955 [Betaproteobacteria bacterium RIFCSPLOWO2_12_FULL_63_13]